MDLYIDIFSKKVLNYFNMGQPYWDILYCLAACIQQTLFYNEAVEEKGRGYNTGTEMPTATIISPVSAKALGFLSRINNLSEGDHRDPLMCRTNDGDIQEICGNLTGAMEGGGLERALYSC